MCAHFDALLFVASLHPSCCCSLHAFALVPTHSPRPPSPIRFTDTEKLRELMTGDVSTNLPRPRPHTHHCPPLRTLRASLYCLRHLHLTQVLGHGCGFTRSRAGTITPPSPTHSSVESLSRLLASTRCIAPSSYLSSCLSSLAHNVTLFLSRIPDACVHTRIPHLHSLLVPNRTAPGYTHLYSIRSASCRLSSLAHALSPLLPHIRTPPRPTRVGQSRALQHIRAQRRVQQPRRRGGDAWVAARHYAGWAQ